MAQNFKKDGKTINWNNGTGSAVTSGSPIFIAGGKVCVALQDIASNANGIAKTDGVWLFPKTTPLVISQGDKVFWNGTAVTKTATDKFLGECHEPAASTDGFVEIDITGDMGGTQSAFVAQVSTPNATDLTTAEALANQLKTTLNATLTSLINSGQMAGS